MNTSPNLTFNILTFKHPKEEYTFYFTKKESENTQRVFHTLVPDEVRKNFGEQEHYYTSFINQPDSFFPVTKKSKPVYRKETNEEGEEVYVREDGSAFSVSILKRYYNSLIHAYFKDLEYLVKPNFIDDTEIWIPGQRSNDEYTFYEKFTVKVQIAKVTKQPELLITYAGQSKVFKKSIADFIDLISPKCFNWVIFNNNLYKFEELPEEAKRKYEEVFPVWNFEFRNALRQETEAPEKGNRYIKFKNKVSGFVKNYICTESFKSVIPVDCEEFIKAQDIKIGKVSFNSNRLIFGNKNQDLVPMNGMKVYGPLEVSPYSKIHFFYIFHKNDRKVADKIDKYFKGEEYGFKGLYKFSKTLYHTERGFSIVFENKANPIPEIEEKLRDKDFDDEVRYIAIYLSPFNKHVHDSEQRSIYYIIKELLLKRGITSQVIESEKVLSNDKYYFSLANIAIAILAKLDGTPWRLDAKLKNELIVGVGAYKNLETDVQYVGSAFSFMNNGKFNRFECFQKNQVDELAGSIIRAVKEYANINSGIDRLIIHFFKNMNSKEFDPIKEGLKEMGLNIPVFILSINKTESHDIVAFDNDWSKLMPASGTYINLEHNRFLLFNNTRYNDDTFRDIDGFPFPIKLSITCTDPELTEDTKIVRELIDQVYQFSRMYWKSVRQQNLPVTIKYPEMVAEIFPYFVGNEIPDFGKDNLWFL
ncbi:MAG: hypothetical protein JXB49_22870 [Bacteroidales bacterium]|nr:hypothetical protein [Bacteroidales bacterium]